MANPCSFLGRNSLLELKQCVGSFKMRCRYFKSYRLNARRTTTRPLSDGYQTFRFALQESRGYVPTLSPSQVSNILAYNEASLENPFRSALSGFESNHLSSNSPTEDRRCVAHLNLRKASVFSVIDGHGGPACAQSVMERLFSYIAVSLLDPHHLEKLLDNLRQDKPWDLLKSYDFPENYSNSALRQLYDKNLQKFVEMTLSLSGIDHDHAIHEALSNAYQQLDNDICSEPLPSAYNPINMDAIQIALSGACAITAYVENSEVYVANIGDTRAVLGSVGPNGKMKATLLSNDHNAENVREVQHLKEKHPVSEHNFILKNGRLLGQLIPLRAFGDVRYKWLLKDLKALSGILGASNAQNIIPMNYHSPPYLSAKPEIIHHQLSPGDKFIIIASDGLWETMSNEEAVNLVSNHIEGKSTGLHYEVTDPNMTMKELNEVLKKRKSGLANKPTTSNSATHLLRHALGPEHRKISEMLTLPPEVVRYYRDDITIIVVYFDEDFVANSTNNTDQTS